jgi:hypothetical protein
MWAVLALLCGAALFPLAADAALRGAAFLRVPPGAGATAPCPGRPQLVAPPSLPRGGVVL